MNVFRKSMVITAMVLSHTLFAQWTPPDPCWMLTDSAPLKSYSVFRYCDTSMSINLHCTDQLTDSGDSYDSTPYINFDYRFSTDSVIARDPFSDVIVYHDGPRPGFAGFKAFWDQGMSSFPLAKYKYLILAHKGPLPTHKVIVKFWYAPSGGEGSPSYIDSIGTFRASSTWKVDTIPIPERIYTDTVRQKACYWGMVVIINNIDQYGLAISPRGNLKIDNIRLEGLVANDKEPEVPEEPVKKARGCGAGMAIAFFPPLMFMAIARRKRTRVHF